MTDFSSLHQKTGKCSNFGNCSLADARTTVQVPTGADFVCTECGKPLLMMGGDGQAVGSSSKTLWMGVGAVAVVLAAAGGGWMFMRGGASVPPSTPTPPPAIAPAPAPVAAPATATVAPLPSSVPAPAPAPAPVPVTGHCSEADAQAGLCKKR